MNAITYSSVFALLFQSHTCCAFSSSYSPLSRTRSLILRSFPRVKSFGPPVHRTVIVSSHNQGNEEEEQERENWDTSTSTSLNRKGQGFRQDSNKKNKYNNSDDWKKKKKASNAATTTSSSSTTTTTVEFELQELRAQLKEMAQKNINSASLSNEKRQELEEYVQTVCEAATTSPIPLSTIATAQPTPLLGLWRLVFSTEKATLSILPREATVYVNILTSPKAMGDDGILEYTLQFSMGALREIKAISTYTIDVSILGTLGILPKNCRSTYVSNELYNGR
jgi:hypothetical protein